MYNVVNNQIKRSSYAERVNSRLFPLFLQLGADIIAIVISFSIQFYLRFYSGLFEATAKLASLTDYIAGIIVLSIYWLTLLFFSGMYKNWYEKSPFEEMYSVLKVSLIGCGLIVFFIFYDSSHSPRLLFLIYFFVISFFLVLNRTIARRIQKSLRQRRIIYTPSIVIGTLKRAVEFYKKSESAKSWGYKVLGVILTNPSDIDFSEYDLSGEIAIGDVAKFNEILDAVKPTEVIITTATLEQVQMLKIVNECVDRNIRVMIEPDIYEIFTGQAKTQNIYGIPLIEISTQLLKPWQEVIKRIFDITFSFAVLVIGLPLWLIISIIVKLESKGPVFYKQKRVGKGGKIFWIYKFRSMVVGADKGEQWTIINDPRVTKFGKILRKTHLDEIPQFWNAFIGDMSIVGPRPEQPQLVEEWARILPPYKRRLKVRPGITGWWQVNYAPFEVDEEEIRNRLKDDFYYIENMSLKLDLEIVARTVWCVVKGHGQA